MKFSRRLIILNRFIKADDFCNVQEYQPFFAYVRFYVGFFDVICSNYVEFVVAWFNLVQTEVAAPCGNADCGDCVDYCTAWCNCNRQPLQKTADTRHRPN